MEREEGILIINPVPDIDISLSTDEWREKTKGRKFPESIRIPAEAIKNNIKDFQQEVAKLLKDVDVAISGFELEEVEISAAVTVTGKLGLVNIGGEIGGEGGIKFVFKRQPFVK
jgi:hypothetical protein